MPMIDLTYPEGALDAGARAEAVEKLTAALLRHEGAADNEQTRAMSWTLVHELPHHALNVAGSPVERPVYRVLVTVPEGTLLQGPGPVGSTARRNLVREVTEVLLAAEGTAYSEAEAGRVYCLVREVTDGYWGGMGTTFRMEDIVATATPEAPQTEVSERARASISALVAERSGTVA
ncbi:MAG TPA: 4-oxalocrotonate tautomerase [Solirubrobacterales bacterium]|nr:4-oxalocrotonate tautomerase [Solirubrobacterales bacterium]